MLVMMKRVFLAFILLALASGATSLQLRAGIAGAASGAMAQVNTMPNDNSNGSLPVMLDWYAQAQQPTLRLAAGGSVTGAALQSHVDSNYNLTTAGIAGCNQYDFYIYQNPQTLTSTYPNLDGLAMTMTWQAGVAVTGVSTFPATAVTFNAVARTATFSLPAGSGSGNVQVRMGLNDALGSAPTNIHVYKTANAALFAGGQLSDPDWDAFHAPFGSLRFMDQRFINNSVVTNYSDVATTSFAFWTSIDTTGGLKVGIPTALIAEIANKTGHKVWVPIPHLATDAYVTALATELKSLITFSGSAVRVQFEYSNEWWNGQFAQTTYVQTQGVAAGWTTSTDYSKGQQWGGYRAAQVMELIRAVFGTDSGNQWEGRLAVWTVSTSITTDRLTGVSHHISADPGVPPGTTIAKLFSTLDVAPYLGPGVLNDFLTGSVTTPGSGYVNGTYSNVPLTGGSGQQAKATIVVSAGAVSTVTLTPFQGGAGYLIGDTLSASNASLGGSGSGLVVTVTDVGGGSSTQDMLGWIATSQATFNTNFYNQLKLSAASNGVYLNMAFWRAQWLAQKTVADSNGLGMGEYEGGVGPFVNAAFVTYSPTNAALLYNAFAAFANTTQAAQLTYDMMALFHADTGGMPSQYNGMSPWSQFGDWGMQQTFQDNTSPRAVAVKAYNAGQSYP